MLGFFIGVMAIYIIVVAAAPILLMWLAGRFIGRRTAIALGVLATAFVLYTMADIYLACRAEPIFHPPAPGSDGEGSYTFPCDAPAGVFLHGYYVFAGPISVLLLMAATFRHYRLMRR